MKLKYKVHRIKEVCSRILSQITPSNKERKEVHQFAQHMKNTLTRKIETYDISAEVQIQGSIAKDTWLAGEKDIDIFILISETKKNDAFFKVLDIVKIIVGKQWKKAYAEHPYIEAEVEGYKIDFVPCFKIKKAEEAVSSVDRTPLHTAYIRERVNPQTKKDIRLLKQFMHGIGTYGAEVKIRGFSGYLCELLILHYKSFFKTLDKTSTWKIGEVIDIENLYEGRLNKVKRLFNKPLIVIDPVDSTRNVAAAVSKQSLGELIMASRIFLTKPKVSFFKPPKTRALSTLSLKKRLTSPAFDLISIIFRTPMVVPDILWGQLYKSLRSLQRLLVRHDFQVSKTMAWSDEGGTNVFLFALESNLLPHMKKHVGPYIYSKEANTFLEKYVDSDTAIFKPWIEGERWMVAIKRRYLEAVSLLQEHLKDGGRSVGVATGLVKALKTSMKIKVNAEIIDFYSANQDFAKGLTKFLSGKPCWLGEVQLQNRTTIS